MTFAVARTPVLWNTILVRAFACHAIQALLKETIVNKSTAFVAAGWMCLSSAVAMAQNTPMPSQSQADVQRPVNPARDNLSSQEFVTKAAAAGKAEVAMGKMGTQKAESAAVKSFAEKMVTDHTKANQELASTAKAAGHAVPANMDLNHDALDRDLERVSSGKEFDQKYMDQMVKDHLKAVDLFEQAASARDVAAALQAFAKKTLPTLREHLNEAQRIRSQLGS